MNRTEVFRIGFAFCKKVLEQNNNEIWIVFKQLNTGTTIYVRLNLKNIKN